jgi:tetratricopeptide (TPR) repeat protein
MMPRLDLTTSSSRLRGWSLWLALAVGATTGATAQVRVTVPVGQLEQQARRDSNNPETQYQLAMGYWSKRQWDDAERILQTVVSIDPRSAKGHLALAMLPYARRERLRSEVFYNRVPAEFKDAVEASERRWRLAFMIDPMVSQKIIGAVEPDPTRHFPSTWEAQQIRSLIFQWSEDFYDERYGTAYRRLQNLIREAEWARGRDKIPGFIRWARGLSAAHIAMFDSAIADFRVLYQRALEEQDADSIIYVPLRTNEYRYILGVFHLNQGAIDSAIALFRTVAENDIGLFMAHVHLANIYEAKAMLDEAVAERQAAIAANPDDATLYYEAGVTLVRAGQNQEALEMMLAARQANPREPWAPFAVGILELSMRKYVEAEASLEGFLAIAPAYMTTQIERAREELATLKTRTPSTGGNP